MKNGIFILLLIIWTGSCRNDSVDTSVENQIPEVKSEILEPAQNKIQYELVADGKPLPIANLKTPENKVVKTKRFKNKPLVINFWASWCEPCLTDTPKFQELSEDYPEANFISVSIDNKMGEWKQFLVEKNWSGNHFFIGRNEENPLFPLVYSEISSEEVQGVHIALPKYIFITKDGTISKRNSSNPQSTAFRHALNEFLK